MRTIFSNCGSGSNKAVRIPASLLSYRFIEHCLHKDSRAIPPEDNSTSVLLAENCVFGTVEKIWLEETKTSAAGWGFKTTAAANKYNDIYAFLGFTPEEVEGFAKWHSRRVKPYCRNNGLNTDEYPISPPLLLEIAKLKDTDTESVITYFEHYCSIISGPVSLDLINLVADNFKLKASSLDLAIVNELLLAFPDKVIEYKAGKTNLINLFFGEYLKRLTDKNIDKGEIKSELTKYFNQ